MIWYGNNVFVGLVLLAGRLLFVSVCVQSGLHLHRGVCILFFVTKPLIAGNVTTFEPRSKKLFGFICYHGNSRPCCHLYTFSALLPSMYLI